MGIVSHKVVYYEDSNYKLEFQIAGNIAFVHCEVFKWTPSVLKNMYMVFKTLCEEAKQNDIKRIATFTPNPKFAKLFGGHTAETLYYNGEDHEVIVWVLE